MKKSTNKFLDKIKNFNQDYIAIVLIVLSFVCALSYRIYTTQAVNYIAKEVQYTPPAGLKSTNVQDALEEIIAKSKNNTFTSSTWLVQFNSNGGTEVQSQAVIKNQKLASVTSTRLNYTLVGWYTTSDFTESSKWNFDTPVTQSMTLYAKWKSTITYTVTFKDGETTLSTQTVGDGEKATRPINPNKQGNNFSGWYSDQSYSNEWNFNTPVTQNITLYAKWTTNSHTVSFDTNGGTSVQSYYKEYGAKLTEPNPAPTKEGYTLEGWYTDNSFSSDKKVDFNTYTMPDDDITLHAKWEGKQVCVTFYLDISGSGVFQKECTSYNNKISKPEDPTKTGYTFADWYTTSTLSETFNFNTTITADSVLYAKWTANQYVISFNLNTNGVTNPSTTTNPDQIYVTYNDNITLPNGSYSSTSHDFDGWYYNNKKYNTGDTMDIASNITLEAKWTVKSYEVTFDSNGGDNAPASQTVPYGGKVEEPDSPTRSHYDFKGWCKNPECTQAFDVDNDTITGATTIYAKWEKHTYSLIFKGETNGGNTLVDDLAIKWDDEVSLSDKQATKDGYEMIGWSTEPGVIDTIGNSFKLNDDKFISGEDIILYAVYRKTNTLTFVGNGAELEGNTTYSCYQYNNDESCSLGEVIAPGIKRYPESTDEDFSNKYTIVGFNQNSNAQESEWDASTNGGQSNYSISSNQTFYAITYFNVEIQFYANNNTITLDGNTATGNQYLPSECQIWNTNSECMIKLPVVKGSNNTPNIGLWQIDPTARSETVGLASGLTEVAANTDGVAYNASGDRVRFFYALTKSSKKTINVKYKIGDGVKSIEKEKDSCTYKDTYNGNIEASCKITLPKITPNDGFRSGKWYFGANSFNPNEVISVSEDREFEAIASAMVYTVKFDTAGGTTINDQFLKYNEKVKKPDNPIRNGYSFKGWYTTSDYTKKFDFTKGVTTDTIIYAKFKKNSKDEDTTITIPSSTSKSSISIDETDINSETIAAFSEEEVNEEEKNKIKQEFFENAIDIYVTDTTVKDKDGNIIDASESVITYKIPLPSGMKYSDNIKVFVIKDGQLEEIAYTVENGYVIFTVNGTGRFVIANYPKSEIAAENNQDITISINDRLKEIVDKFDVKIYSGNEKTDMINRYFDKKDDVYIFDSILYDVNGDEINSTDDYIIYSVPLPSGMSENDDITLYRIQNGKRKVIDYTIENGKIVFTVKGTGTFAIVKHNSAKTKASSKVIPIVVIILIIILAGGSGFYIYKKKKNNA